ncbi:MAG: 5'-methylthioadenosine/adenosylhomocysteine nucleosidase [Mycoplasmatota bacterium]
MDKDVIGIIIAMEEELNEIQKVVENKETIKIYDLEFIKGTINNTNCIMVKCGVGKVNAGRVTQILIDKFSPLYILNLGTAGAINESLNIGDVIIAHKVVQHDFDITAFNHQKGYIPNVGVFMESDEELIKKSKTLINQFKKEKDYINDEINKRNSDFSIDLGVVASGDIFCESKKMKEKIYTKFNADVVDMECAAISQVAKLCGIPFLTIRCISDIPNGKNNYTFDENLEFASYRCSLILKKICE